MTGALIHLALGGSGPPRASLPTTIQVAFPFFASSMAGLFLALGGRLEKAAYDAGFGEPTGGAASSPFPQACSNWMISTAGATVTWDLLELQN